MTESMPAAPGPEGELPVADVAAQVNAAFDEALPTFNGDMVAAAQRQVDDMAPPPPHETGGYPDPQTTLTEIEQQHNDSQALLNQSINTAIKGEPNPVPGSRADRTGVGFGPSQVTTAVARQNLIDSGGLTPGGQLSDEARDRLDRIHPDLADTAQRALNEADAKDELIVPPGFEDYNEEDK